MKLELFEKYCSENNVNYKMLEPMNRHTSFKIGGPADMFITVSSVEQLVSVINKAVELDVNCFILGKGSNILASDNGIEGAVISLAGINDISVSGDEIRCGAGLSLSELCITAAENGLSGLEFAYGIPGTVGGGLFMNAGAYGGEMSDVVKEAEYISFDGKKGVISAEEMQLGYRTSIFKNSNMIITAVTFKLSFADKTEIRSKMDDFLHRRKDKQPLDFPSGGSTFKRPEGYFAGSLIEKNGLKGKTVGGAMVSEKHAGFVINYNNASGKDVKELIKIVKETVLKSDGVNLEPEIIFVGRE